jgi:hypothetical protein
LSCCVDLYPTLALPFIRGGDKSFTFHGEIHPICKLKVVNDNSAPSLSKGRLGGNPLLGGVPVGRGG